MVVGGRIHGQLQAKCEETKAKVAHPGRGISAWDSLSPSLESQSLYLRLAALQGHWKAQMK